VCWLVGALFNKSGFFLDRPQGIAGYVKKKFNTVCKYKTTLVFSDTQVCKETTFCIWVSTIKLTLYLLSINKNNTFVSY
jgi:hypothetical protein